MSNNQCSFNPEIRKSALSALIVSAIITFLVVPLNALFVFMILQIKSTVNQRFLFLQVIYSF